MAIQNDGFPNYRFKSSAKSPSTTMYVNIVLEIVKMGNIDKWQIHQIVSPNSNSDSTIFFRISFYISVSTCKLRKKKLFWTKKKFGFNCSNWEKFVEKIREINWWKHLMNSLTIHKSLISSILHLSFQFNCKQLRKTNIILHKIR